MHIELPNAILGPDGTWTKDVDLLEMQGEEEDILADQTRKPGKGTLLRSGPQRITDILSRVTRSIGNHTRPDGKDRYDLPDYFAESWRKAYTSDRVFAFIRLRQLSLGDEYTFSMPCPSCKKEISGITVDLSTLKVNNISLEVAEKASHAITLPRCGKQIEWRFLSGEGDETFVENTLKTNKSDHLTVLLSKRLVGVPQSYEFMRRLSSFDRRYLGMQMDATEGGIETGIEIGCDGCGSEFATKIHVTGASFFFPSEIDTTKSSTSALSPNAGGGLPKPSTDSPSQNEEG